MVVRRLDALSVPPISAPGATPSTLRAQFSGKPGKHPALTGEISKFLVPVFAAQDQAGLLVDSLTGNFCCARDK
jgi:hypothetical protein